MKTTIYFQIIIKRVIMRRETD